MSREYPSYAIAGVGAVLFDGSRILLIKRGYPPGEGVWSVPGGAIEAGEDLCRAAVRELEEETGLRAKPLGIVWVFQVIVRDSAGRPRYHYVVVDVAFDVSTIEGSLRPGGDAVDAGWFELSNPPQPLSRGTRALIEYLSRSGLKTLLPLPCEV